MAANHKERKHALLSASGASRWMNCTPSARLEENFVEEESSVYAAEGTLAHEFADIGLQKFDKLMTTRRYNAEVKKLKTHDLYDPEMDKEVQKYLDYVIEEFKVAQKATPDAVLSIEEKLDLTSYIEEGFGTGDVIIIADGVLKVIDLKYGKGLRVNAENNPQLKLYGLGALEANEIFYDIHTVEVTVVQPRLDHIDSWQISAEELKAWAEKEVKPKAKEAYEGEGLQRAGEWCKFCKAAPRCATLAAANLKLIDDEFADPHLLNDSQLLEVYGKMGQIQNWIKAVTTYLLKEAIAGKEWPGYKLVEGRSVRKWANEDEVIQVLKELNYTEDDIMNVKLQGLTAIEKLLGKKQFSEVLSELVIKPQGAPTLVNKSDKRPEWSSAEQDFKNE